MKSHSRKKRLLREQEKTRQAAAARDSNMPLMAMYEGFLSTFKRRSGGPKFTTDKWGNRVLTESLIVSK